MRKTRLQIYQSRWQIALVIIILAAPFAFLLLFSRVVNVAAGRLLWDGAVSFLRIAAAYTIAAILGWIFAVSFYRGRRAAVALPIFDVLQSFPTFAALPLAALFWGPSNFTVIFFLVITVIWPLFFSIISSLKLIRRDWQDAVEMARLGPLDYLRKFIWPASKPGLITGSIIGLGEGWEALVATEIIVNVKAGLGNFFGSFSLNPAVTAFGIIGLLMFIFSINKLLWLPLLERSHRQMEE